MKRIMVCGPVYTLKLVSISQKVIEGACHLGNVVITGDGGAGDADVYDGVNDLGEHKLHLEALTGVTFSTGAGQCHAINKGIYVRVNNTTTFVMVTFRTPNKEEEENEKEEKKET